MTAEQGQALWQATANQRLKGKRDRALLAVLLACGLRRHEAAALTFDHLQQKEEHWAIVDLVGKGGRVRAIPVPDWVRCELDSWFTAAGITSGKLFRRVSSAGNIWGQGLTEKVVWHMVKEFAKKIGVANLAPHDLRRTCARPMPPVANWSRSNSCWGTSLCRPRSAIWGCKQSIRFGRERPHRYRADAVSSTDCGRMGDDPDGTSIWVTYRRTDRINASKSDDSRSWRGTGQFVDGA